MTEITKKAIEAAEREFTEYFVRNYPGPDTIIFDPKWHAPKLFRAATHSLISSPGKDGGQEAARIGDSVLAWMVKYDLLDAGNEYRAEDVLAVLSDFAPDPFPQPIRKDSGEPCGECHIQPGETCDICGAKNAQDRKETP